MHSVQELMQPIEAHESSFICHEMPPVITPVFKATPNLMISYLCQSYKLACSKCYVPKEILPTKARHDQKIALS